MNLVQYIVHRITDGSRHRAVDRRGGGLVLLRAGVRHDAAGRNGATAQRPDKFFKIFFAVRLVLHVGERPGNPAVRIVYAGIDHRPRLWPSAGTWQPRYPVMPVERNPHPSCCLQDLQQTSCCPILPDSMYTQPLMRFRNRCQTPFWRALTAASGYAAQGVRPKLNCRLPAPPNLRYMPQIRRSTRCFLSE